MSMTELDCMDITLSLFKEIVGESNCSTELYNSLYSIDYKLDDMWYEDHITQFQAPPKQIRSIINYMIDKNLHMIPLLYAINMFIHDIVVRPKPMHESCSMSIGNYMSGPGHQSMSSPIAAATIKEFHRLGVIEGYNRVTDALKQMPQFESYKFIGVPNSEKYTIQNTQFECTDILNSNQIQLHQRFFIFIETETNWSFYMYVNFYN